MKTTVTIPSSNGDLPIEVHRLSDDILYFFACAVSIESSARTGKPAKRVPLVAIGPTLRQHELLINKMDTKTFGDLKLLVEAEVASRKSKQKLIKF